MDEVMTEQDPVPLPLALHPPSLAYTNFLSRTKWAVLGLCCLASFSNNYAADSPEVLYEEMKVWWKAGEPHGVEIDFDLFYLCLYVFFSMPNLVIPVFGGMLVDKFGGGTMVLCCLGVMSAGQSLVAIGMNERNAIIAISGRFMVGLGSEVVLTSVSSIIAEWFAMGNLSVAIGLMLACLRVGQITSALAGSRIALERNVVFAFGVGAIVLVMAFIVAGGSLVYLQKKIMKLKSKEPELHIEKPEEKEEPQGRCCSKQCSSLKTFPVTYWLLVAQLLFGNPAYISFCQISSALFVERYCGGPECCEKDETSCDKYVTASELSSYFLLSIVILFAVSSPLVGLFIDKFGSRAILSCLGAIIMATAHILVLFSDVSLYVSGTLIGVGYALFFVSTWASVPVLIAEEHHGVGFGCLLIADNVAGVIVPLVVAQLVGAYNTFTAAVALLLACSCVAFLVTIALNVFDKFRSGAVLNKFASDKPSSFVSDGSEVGYFEPIAATDNNTGVSPVQTVELSRTTSIKLV